MTGGGEHKKYILFNSTKILNYALLPLKGRDGEHSEIFVVFLIKKIIITAAPHATGGGRTINSRLRYTGGGEHECLYCKK